MRDHSLKRSLLLSIVSLFAAPALFAGYPSARLETRMVFSPALHRTVLYGGITTTDRGTKQAYDLSDTWEWYGSRWAQRFPAHNPGPRSGHVMVYDANRQRIVLFGGRHGFADFSDTWVYLNDDWTQLDTPNKPGIRVISGAAFDPIRDRIVLYGGTQQSSDGKTSTPLYDTWEFDGTTWTQRGGEGPKIGKPLLTYDAARNQIIMLGLNDKSETQMYLYDGAAGTWKQLSPTTLPACVNEGMMTYQSANNTVFFTGGICTGSSSVEDNYEWDGTNWTKLTVIANAGRVFGAAIADDSDGQIIYMFGGTLTTGLTRASTLAYKSTLWIDVTPVIDPAPRSLFTFTTDPDTSTIWMYGGVDDSQNYGDFWKFQNGQWEQVLNDKTPVGCLYPVAAYDTDRKKLVLVCAGSSTYEWDGQAWTQFTGLKDAPPVRRFSSMVYDASLKKTVLFGGWDSNYIDQTWMWNGTAWTQAKNKPAPPRGLAAMWYDPNLKKTVMYGGLGRLTLQGSYERFGDMWTFDGSGWSTLKPAGATPGQRYGAQVTVDPRTNHVILFGGLRFDVNDLVQTQVYADDTWEWDGTAWTKLAPGTVPPARENASLTFDPVRSELVMFGGYAGHYFSDTWGFNAGNWHQRIENTQRRRSARR